MIRHPVYYYNPSYKEPAAVPRRLPAVEQLLAFVTVAQHGSFTRAAADLRLTQSAVSHQIRKLEAAVGRRLLNRTRGVATPTRSGRLLIEDISGPLRALGLAIDRCRGGGVSKRLGLELDSGFAAAWLAPRLGDFESRHPEIQLEHFYSLKLEFPAYVDLAIKWGNGRWPGFRVEPLMGLHYTPVCAPQLLKSGRLNEPDDLRRFTLLHDRERRDWADWLALVRVEGIDLERGHVVNDTNVLTGMLSGGKGIGLCALELAEQFLKRGELVAPFPGVILRSDQAYYIVRKSTERNDCVSMFISWIKGQVTSYLKLPPHGFQEPPTNRQQCLSTARRRK